MTSRLRWLPRAPTPSVHQQSALLNKSSLPLPLPPLRRAQKFVKKSKNRKKKSMKNYDRKRLQRKWGERYFRLWLSLCQQQEGKGTAEGEEKWKKRKNGGVISWHFAANELLNRAELKSCAQLLRNCWLRTQRPFSIFFPQPPTHISSHLPLPLRPLPTELRLEIAQHL